MTGTLDIASNGSREMDLVIKRFRLIAKDICRNSGVGESKLSLYRKGERSLDCANLIKLIRALPVDARITFCEMVFFDNEISLGAAMSERKTNFARFLAAWMEREGVTFEELALAMETRTPLDREELRKIVIGEKQPDFNELAFLGIILSKENGEGYTLDELGEIRDGLHNGECNNSYTDQHNHH